MATSNQPEAVQKGVRELEKEITCPICQDRFREPKILPCCHYYCKGCVQALANRVGASKPFACPECRCDTFLPQNDADQLPTAFFVNRMMDVHSKMEKAEGKVEALCELCSGSKASAFCRQCAEFICDKCTEAHHRMKMFADHKVNTLEELKEGVAKIPTKQAPPPMCKVHDEQRKIYCHDCKGLVCRDCLLDDHAGHKYDFVKKAAPAIKQLLVERLVPLREVQESLSDASKAVKTTKSEIETQGATAAASIEQSFQELYQILDQRKREMLNEVSSRVKEKLDGLSVQEKGIDTASGTIQSLVEFVERNIENATEEELMVVHTQMLDRVDEEIKKHQQSRADLEPVEEADIEVKIKCAKELRNLCRNKSTVGVATLDPALLTVRGDGLKSAEINKSSKVTLYAMSSLGRPYKKAIAVKAKVTSVVDGSVIRAEVQKEGNVYEIEYTPAIRGRHHLNVTVNGLPVAGSPFHMFAKIPPTQLGKAVKVFSGYDSYGIAINSEQELVVAMKDGDIVFLDRAGNKLRSIKQSEGVSPPLYYGIAVDSKDNIYVTDGRHGAVYMFDKLGTKLKSSAVNINPRGITLSGEHVIVADGANKQLVYFSRDLEFIKKIAFCGKRPVGVACDEEGKLYVCDHTGDCVKVLNAQGELQFSFSQKGNQLSKPYSIGINGEFVYVTEWGGKECVSVFTKEGKYITSFENKFNCPCGLVVDSDGFVYVCDVNHRQIHVF